MTRRLAVVPAMALLATGCLASKSDIRLLQDELRATRSQLAMGDTSLMRSEDARRAQIAALSVKIDHMNDSLRLLAVRFASFQAAASGEYDAMGRQMVQVQALLGQTTKNVQDTRAQLEALREQSSSPSTPVIGGSVGRGEHGHLAARDAGSSWSVDAVHQRQGSTRQSGVFDRAVRVRAAR